jgi:SAM-dependent methyltransferase
MGTTRRTAPFAFFGCTARICRGSLGRAARESFFLNARVTNCGLSSSTTVFETFSSGGICSLFGRAEVALREERMSDATPLSARESRVVSEPKDKSRLLRVIERHLQACGVDRTQPVLVVGGGQEDLEILSACGFSQIVLSNLAGTGTSLDAEQIDLPDNSYPVVFAHAVLHHCRSPQKALGEMVRVAQKHVFFVEPNDCGALRMLVRLGFSFPYEIGGVANNGYTGGLRNGLIPNYIYRWTEREVIKSVLTYHPERQFEVRSQPYWDFYVNEEELLARKETKLAALASKLGARNFIVFLRLAQALLSMSPLLRSQGNKFFCAISKQDLQPWIEVREDQYCIKRDWATIVTPRTGGRASAECESRTQPLNGNRFGRIKTRINDGHSPGQHCFLQWQGILAALPGWRSFPNIPAHRSLSA